KMANIDRKDISVVECHDCFSFTELMNIEDLGFVEKGKGGWFAADGNTRLGGKLPVNTSGGLCSKGHPIGATGVGQIVEMAWQLQDKSDKRQVENAKFALTHVLGGPGSVSTVHILGRGDI
ncbi:MAG: acetyl-CoA acetyltransferase, partial [Leptospiraceae bacterium]|nr:acetyl-CoA acetyltransferase [Leptospiraceae bacterium]